ncbi:MAG TPA: hypothetical protein VIG76_05265 [Amnibacterium sp.]|uniref:lipopolysaccharide biosynthesis protein n=1 Tax=Amnibacterium sp. TaxID=1872496 RepID=UPI002F941B58
MTGARGLTGPFRRWLDEPLLRNGYALVLNVGLTTLLGVAFWVVAARLYRTEDVGLGSALVSALLLISSFGQLGIGLGLPRYLPVAGARAGGMLARAYLVTGLVAAVAGLAFAFLAPGLSPEFAFLGRSPWFVPAFCGAAVVWTVFALQDSAIIGLRRSVWIPLENSAYGVLKLALIVPFALVLPQLGVFAGWVLAAAVVSIPVNIALFRRWAPAQVRVGVAEGTGVSGLWEMRRFLAFNYGGQVCYIASTTVLPLIVAAQLGATENGYFYIVWTTATSADLVSINLAQALTVESAVDSRRLAEHLRRVVPQVLALQGAAALVVLVFAHLLLSIYGPAYADHAAMCMRLVMISLLPRAVIVLSIAVARVRNRLGHILVVQAVCTAGTLGLAIVVARPWGLTGVALAWLVTQSVVAAVLLPGLFRSMRLPRRRGLRSGPQSDVV